jgi:hypothetical protein
MATCTTDAAGRFRFAELDGGQYRLWTQDPPAQRGDPFDLATGSQCTRDLVLPAK